MYKISEKEPSKLSIAEVVAERAELLIERKRKDWQYHVLEKFDRRLRILDGLIVEEFLRTYKWISVSERLPEDKTYVMAIHNRGTWKDEDDSERVNVVIVKFVRGISKKERDRMPECDRKTTYTSADEGFNNEKPYYWDCFGPDCFFGQAITHWKPIVMPEKL